MTDTGYPALSLIIPVFNAQKYLPLCLDSIIAAHIPKIEIILVDDGSRDNSPEICRQYSDNNGFIRTISQKNAGPAAARNTGLAHAKGRFVAFIDADDYVDSEAFARHVSLLDKYEADVWASDFRRVADNGCVLDEVFQIGESPEPIFEDNYIKTFLSAKDCVWNVWRYIFRRDFLESKQLRFAEGFNIAEDLEFVVRAINAAEQYAFFHLPYYFYRVNYGLSLTRRYTLQRVRQLMCMLSRANMELGNTDTGRLLGQKLAREYILNLSLLWELPKKDRAEALQALKASEELLLKARGVYAVAAKAVRGLGVPLAAYMLYCAKSVKRLVRKVKTGLFTGGSNA